MRCFPKRRSHGCLLVGVLMLTSVTDALSQSSPQPLLDNRKRQRDLPIRLLQPDLRAAKIELPRDLLAEPVVAGRVRRREALLNLP